MSTGRVLEVPLGGDLFANEVLVAACRDAGLQVELVRNEHPETGGFVPLGVGYLLVREVDVDLVAEIRARTEPSHD